MKDTPVLLMLKDRRPESYALLKKSREQRRRAAEGRREANQDMFWRQAVRSLDSIVKKMEGPKELDINDSRMFVRLLLEVLKKL